MFKHNSCILNCEMDHVKVPEHLLTKLGYHDYWIFSFYVQKDAYIQI